MTNARAPSSRLLTDVVCYQLGWFACVLGASHGRAWTGVTAALALVGFHFVLLEEPGRRWAELRLLVVVVIVGLAVDGTLSGLGWVRFPEGQPAPFLPPIWMLCLWALFATLLPGALAWLRGRPVLGAALGALGGPLAYLAGQSLGAIGLAAGPVPLVALAVAWGLVIPALIALAQRLVPAATA